MSSVSCELWRLAHSRNAVSVCTICRTVCVRMCAMEESQRSPTYRPNYVPHIMSITRTASRRGESATIQSFSFFFDHSFIHSSIHFYFFFCVRCHTIIICIARNAKFMDVLITKLPRIKWNMTAYQRLFVTVDWNRVRHTQFWSILIFIQYSLSSNENFSRSRRSKRRRRGKVTISSSREAESSKKAQGI